MTSRAWARFHRQMRPCGFTPTGRRISDKVSRVRLCHQARAAFLHVKRESENSPQLADRAALGRACVIVYVVPPAGVWQCGVDSLSCRRIHNLQGVGIAISVDLLCSNVQMVVIRFSIMVAIFFFR